jgi:hypothetical protein
MSEPTRRETENETDASGSENPAGVRQGPPPTPFDHPLFLPALLFAGMLWFGYDGWINQDPDMLEHVDFNRWGFGLLTLATAWFGYKGFNEWKEEKAQRAADETGAPGASR